MSDTDKVIDWHKAAYQVAAAYRAEIMAELEGIDVTDEERQLLFRLAWDGQHKPVISLLRKVKAAASE